LGGIWEVIFSLSLRAGVCRRVARGARAGWRVLARNGARSSSSSETGDSGLIAARACRDSSQRAWSVALKSSRIRAET
jgi:hypothetical protein